MMTFMIIVMDNNKNSNHSNGNDHNTNDSNNDNDTKHDGNDDSLSSLVIECEHGRIVVCQVNQCLVCVCSNIKNCPLGLMRRKVSDI